MEHWRSRAWIAIRYAWLVLRWPVLFILSAFLLLLLKAIVDTPAWKVLDLLVIPAVLAAGVAWFNKSQKEREQEIARERREEEVLQQYFDRMSELLLEHDLREHAKKVEGVSPEVSTIARARTLAVLRTLGPARKGEVVKFLCEAELIDGEQPIVSMKGANLEGADLERAKLQRVNLKSANLNRANLKWAKLHGANLEGANLKSANLQATDLELANLYLANLKSANLGCVFLEGAVEFVKRIPTMLMGADLQRASLEGANLEGARLQRAKLQRARLQGANLYGATLSRVTFEAAKYDVGKKGTKWPEGFDPRAAGAILVDEDGNPVENVDEGESRGMGN